MDKDNNSVSYAIGDKYDDWENFLNITSKEEGSFEANNCFLGICHGKFLIKAVAGGISGSLVSLTIENPNDVDEKHKMILISTSFGLAMAIKLFSAVCPRYRWYLRRNRYSVLAKDELFGNLKGLLLQVATDRQGIFS